MCKVYRFKHKAILLSGGLGSGKDLMIYKEFERFLNKLRFHSIKYIDNFSVHCGRDFRRFHFLYYYYTVMLRCIKWYKRPFYTLKKHCRIYSHLKDVYYEENS